MKTTSSMRTSPESLCSFEIQPPEDLEQRVRTTTVGDVYSDYPKEFRRSLMEYDGLFGEKVADSTNQEVEICQH